MSYMPFKASHERRAVHEEICGWIQEQTGAVPVNGFGRMLDAGDGRYNEGRMSGFYAMAVHQEWLLRLADKSGVRWETEMVPAHNAEYVVFALNIAFGNGAILPQAEGAWQIFVNDRPVVTFRGVNHSQCWNQGLCTLAFSANRIETAAPYTGMCLSDIIHDESQAAFGPALLKVPAGWVTSGIPAVLHIQPLEPVESRRWIQVAPSSRMLEDANIGEVVQMLGNVRFPVAGEYSVFFGDIHTHSGEGRSESPEVGCGVGSRKRCYELARTAGALDFYALTDHEFQIDSDSASYFELADQYDAPGRFACIPAYEHTSLLYGHRNVYFRSGGGQVFDSNLAHGFPTREPKQSPPPEALWKAMEECGVPFFTAPHHPSASAHPLNLDFCDTRYDRLFELYSCWGSSEYYGDFPRGVSDRFDKSDFQQAMIRNLKMGVIASSDSHDACPGFAQSTGDKHHHIFHFCGSGRAAVLAHELTRETVFDALFKRRCYATSGPPIVLDVRVGNAVMGSECSVPTGDVPRLSVFCRGTNGLDHIRVVRNGRVVFTQSCHGMREMSLEWEDKEYLRTQWASYYVRVVQQDRESAWSSPIWVACV